MKVFIIIFIIIVFIFLVSSSNEKAKKKNILKKMVIGKMFQALESIYLIENTLKLNIFKERCEFLYKIASELAANRDNLNYSEYAQSAFQINKSKYYDRVISQLQNVIINNPSMALNADFYYQQEVLWFKRYCNKMDLEINALKTKAAKERRYETILEIAKTILTDLSYKEAIKYHSEIHNELKHFNINLKLDYENDDQSKK